MKATSVRTGTNEDRSGSQNAPAATSRKRGSKSDNAPALVIVESPAKARTISKYLGTGFLVESSIGHIRDLPSTAAEIPEEYKDKNWARLGVNVEEKFEPLYIVPAKKASQVSKLRKLLKNARELYLATDEDREGEAIAWHLLQVLHPKVPVKRMVFDEITREAIQQALANPRAVDDELVEAQEARRILDRLYGYELSPVLWRKIGPRLSAGRVQSVATRLIVNREQERMRFVRSEYWDIEASLQKANVVTQILTKLIELHGQRIASGKDFEETTGALKSDSGALLLDQPRAEQLAQSLTNTVFTVANVTEKPFTQRTLPPFITSSLQQEAARKLRFSVQQTMRLAQELYENGYITYMRTDSTHLSSQAIQAARQQVTEMYGQEYLPDSPRTFNTKAKGAQEAHEAIRPAGASFRKPADVEKELRPEAFRLYTLIWKRTMACQMKDATGSRTSVRFSAPAGPQGPAVFSASGKVIHFPGFLRAYVEGADDPAAELEDQERVLPPLKVGDQLNADAVDARQHFTSPPARFTEASLIKELEELGIGRPSTYASIIETIQDRGYVWKKGPMLVPTLTAFAVTNLLERHFPDLVDTGFTAKMENDLDAIAAGELNSEPWLHWFYYGQASDDSQRDVTHIGLKRRIGTGWDDIDARSVCTVPLGQDENGQSICARIGRYGPYLQVEDGEERANIPTDIPPDELTLETAQKLLSQAAQGDSTLGDDPATGKPVYVKNGRFGPYVQLGDPEVTEKGTLKRGGKPKMASLWPNMSPENITLEQALMLLSFPREIGTHPEKGETITAQDGKYGPYLKMGSDTRSLTSHEQLQSITLDEAVKLFAEPKRRGAAKPAIIRELGKLPDSEAVLQVKNGRFGPYVTDGVVNATIPKGVDPQNVTIEKAAELIQAREQRMREQGKDPRAPKPVRRRTTRTPRKSKTPNLK